MNQSPELSRRLAFALAVENPHPDKRAEIDVASRQAQHFRQLPLWVQNFVVKAERKAKRSRAVTAALADDEEHTGAMIALVPSDADLDRLTLPHGESRDELHLTLAFLGEAADWDAQSRSAVEVIVKLAVRDRSPIEATGFGLALWNPTTEDACVVMNVSGAELADLHRDVWGELQEYDDGRNLLPENHRPWQPHVTLAYASNPVVLAAALDRLGPVTFDRVRIAFAGETTDIKLG